MSDHVIWLKSVSRTLDGQIPQKFVLLFVVQWKNRNEKRLTEMLRSAFNS